MIPIFNTIFLETGAACNRHCVFCPNHGNTRPDEWMSWETIYRVVNQLQTMRWKGRFSPFIYNEPMRDKRIPELATLIREVVPGAWFMVSTNGDYFRSRDDVLSLLRAGCNSLQINVYSEWDADPGRRAAGIRAAEMRLNQLIDLTRGIGDSPHVYRKPKRGRVHLKVERKFATNADDTKLGGTFELQNRSGNISWLQPAITEPLDKMCVRPWRTLNINWRGDAILCCNDYHGVAVMGNVQTQSLEEIWNGAPFTMYRRRLQDKRRDLPLCDTCDYSGGAYPHLCKRV